MTCLMICGHEIQASPRICSYSLGGRVFVPHRLVTSEQFVHKCARATTEAVPKTIAAVFQNGVRHSLELATGSAYFVRRACKGEGTAEPSIERGGDGRSHTGPDRHEFATTFKFIKISFRPIGAPTDTSVKWKV